MGDWVPGPNQDEPIKFDDPVLLAVLVEMMEFMDLNITPEEFKARLGFDAQVLLDDSGPVITAWEEEFLGRSDAEISDALRSFFLMAFAMGVSYEKKKGVSPKERP